MATPRFLPLVVVLTFLAVPAAAQPHSHDAAHPASPPADCPLMKEAGPLPSAAGQGAFGAIAEIVALLEADPATDWSRVSIDRLRDHLVDMNELILRAQTRERPVDGGLEIEVTGESRTRDAIRRMVPAHAAMMRNARPWRIEVETIAAGVRLTVTSDNPREAEKIRGLGFFGFMASDDHHARHHLAIARGAMPH